MSGIRITRDRGGLVLRYRDISIGLDAGIPDGPTLLSHAHADHVVSVADARNIVATRPTLETFSARGGRRVRVSTTVAVGESVSCADGVVVTALNAGHVLGSSMFLIDLGELHVLYTGDFNTVDSLVHTAARPVRAEVLVMEATYGTPQWTFPPRKNVYRDILETARIELDEGRIPCFHAYSLGKAQEAIALFTGAGLPVLVGNKSIDAVSRVYHKHGTELDYALLSSKESRELRGCGCVVVMSSARHMMHNIARVHGWQFAQTIQRRMRSFDLSGWTLPNYGQNGFPLSAHADFPALVRFAHEVEPVITYCFTENAQVLASHLAAEGLPAVPLE